MPGKRHDMRQSGPTDGCVAAILAWQPDSRR
jgi:hypothetical protein